MRTSHLVVALVFATSSLVAQIRWWGVYDFQIQKGGQESNPLQNNLPNGHLQLSAHQFHLFAEAEVNKDISVMAMIANNAARSFDLKQLELQLAYVSFNNLLGDALSLSAGKILTPFGSFAKRQLATDNPLVGKPLFYDYALRISPVTGYLDSAGLAYSGPDYGSRLTSIYRGAYYVGVGASGSFLENVLVYDVAVMNAPLSAMNGDFNVQDNVAFHGRLALHPAIWGTVGASYAVGSFMQASPANASFARWNGPLSKFKQSAMGVDLLFSYLYYELNAEYIVNRFDAPYLSYNAGGGYSSGWSNRTSSNFDSEELLVDLKVEAPFYPGLFVALRLDLLNFSPAEGMPGKTYSYNSSVPWDHDVRRYAVSLGYKPARSILIKLGYETTSVDASPKPDLDVAACNLVVTF